MSDYELCPTCGKTAGNLKKNPNICKDDFHWSSNPSNTVESDGLYDAMELSDDYSDLKDKKFHSLRNKFLKISEELLEYIDTNYSLDNSSD